MGQRHGPFYKQEIIKAMPYTIRKQNCKQSSGKRGTYVLSYTDKKGKKHRNCHTSRKKARGQIAAIEAEGVEKEIEGNTMKITLSELRQIIREEIVEAAEHKDNKKDKKKHDMDDDGDEDAADYKMKQYIAGGMSKEDALKKSRKFDENQ